MAQTLEQIRDARRTSIHGRRLGLTHDDFLGGMKETLKPVTNATSSTTGTALLPYGYHTVVTTAGDTWKLTDPPWAGLEVKLATNSTSTKNHTVSPVAATITSTNGVAGSSIVLQGAGAAVTLMSISTAQWVVTSRITSTGAQTVVVSS